MAVRRFVSMALALLAGVAALASSQAAFAQAGVKYDPYLEIVSTEYVPPEKAGGKQLIRFKFNIAAGVPLGTKIRMKIQYTGLAVDEKVLEVGAKRKDVVYEWVPEKKLGPDNVFQLFRVIPIEEQTPEVVEALEKSKVLPWAARPWPYSPPETEVFTIGTKEEIAALPELACQVYDGLIRELIKNKKDFDEMAEAVKSGKKLVEGGTLDVKGFTELIKSWRIQQAKTQQKIREIPVSHMAVHQRTFSAHYSLINLGRMVSRYAYDVEREITSKYGAPPVRITDDEKDKEDDVLRSYERWNRHVRTAQLNQQVDLIYSEACPEPAKEEGKDGETGEAGAKEGDGEKKAGEGGAAAPNAPAAGGREEPKPAQGKKPASSGAKPPQGGTSPR